MTMPQIKKFVKQAAARLAPDAASTWQNARERRHIRRFEQRMGLNELRNSYLAQHDLSVASGLFAGMRYISASVCSALIPKLVGSYEAELHEIITQALTKGYTAVLDVGCAEGYYANGFALCLPTAPVYAFDIDVQARRPCAAMSTLNNLQDQVIVSGKCDPTGLNALLTSRSLLICDCEGYEEDLLHPELTPALSQTDILVELHDHIRPGVSLLLQERFQKTHQVTLVTAVKRDPADYPKLLFSEAFDRDLAVSEFRAANQQWAFFQTKGQQTKGQSASA